MCFLLWLLPHLQHLSLVSFNRKKILTTTFWNYFHFEIAGFGGNPYGGGYGHGGYGGNPYGGGFGGGGFGGSSANGKKKFKLP